MTMQTQEKKDQVFLTTESCTHYTCFKSSKFTDSLLDNAVLRALKGNANNAILSFDKSLRYSDDSIQYAREKAWELTCKLSQEPATEKDMLRAIDKYTLPIDLELDKPSRLECMTKGAYVKYVSYHVARYVMRSLVKDSESINSLLLDERFGEDTAETIGDKLQDMRARIGSDEHTALLDASVILTDKQYKAWQGMVAGLTQLEIEQTLHISRDTQSKTRRKLWNYLTDTNRI